MSRATAVCVLMLAAGPAGAEDFPSIDMVKGKLTVRVYLPDAEKGFYRGTRFDWSGVFGVQFGKHKLFGPWKDTHDPTNNDDIVGPCEEFGMQQPLGYDEAKVGETFLKIGVGELVKPKEEKYQFFGKYKIAKPAVRKWHIGAGPKFTWTYTADHPSGYGFEYAKSVELKDSATLVIGHRLKNTGTKSITTDFYNHNFFNVDGDPVGPNYSIAFPFEVKANDLRGKFAELVEVRGKELRFKGTVTRGDLMAGITGFAPKNEDHRSFELRHAPSGVRVNVRHAYPFAKVNVWGVRTCICPEPFLQIDGLKPGEAKEWAITYEFTADPVKK